MAMGRCSRTIWPSWLALPSRLRRDALDLLVVLELGLEEPDHLDRRAGRAGDGDRRVPVGREDLLHGPVGDDVALGGPAVAGHHHAVGVAQGHHRGAVAAPPGPRAGRVGAGAGAVGRAGSLRRDEAGEVRARVIAPGGKSGSATGATRPPFWT